MSKTTWLSNLHRMLANPQSRDARHRTPKTNGASIESLERRQLLSAVPAVGAEALVNSFTTGDQTSPAVAMDSAGDYVVAWQSSGAETGIFAQRFNSVGVAQGSAIQVTTDSFAPQVAMDSAGDFVIVWAGSDGNGAGVLAQRYNAAGVAQGSDFVVNTYTTGDQTNPSVAMDAAGDFVVAWESHGQYVNRYAGSIGDSNIYAQRYSSAGAPLGSEFRVDSSSTSVYHNPSVAMDSAGDFVVTFERNDFDNFVEPFTYIAATRYNSSGAVVQGEFGVAFGGQNFLYNPKVAMDPSGDFVIAYWGYNIQTQVDAQLFNSSGANTASIGVNTDGALTQTHPDVAFGGNGDFTVGWQLKTGFGSGDGSGYGVYSQQYDSSGNTIGSVTQVNTYTTGDQVAPTVAMDAAGDIVFAWVSGGQDGSGAGIYSQQFLTATTPLLLQIEGTTLNAIAPLYTPLTNSLTVYDAVNSNWTGATIQFTSGYQNGQDVLSFTNTAKITGNWDASTGTLTLTGIDSVSDYRAALRSVTYHNTSATPNTSITRTISITAQAGATSSNTVTRNLNVVATSVAPTVTGLSATQTFVDPSTPLAIAPSLVVTDPNGLNILSATVSFTNWQAEDRLSFSNSLALQHTFVQDLSAHTATLTITGSASAAGYQTLLQSVTYQDVAGLPNTSAVRIATFTVNDQLHSGSASTNISVVRYLANFGPSVNFIQGQPPVVLAPNLVVTTPAGLSIQTATVSFTNWQGEDRVTFLNTLALQHSFTQDLNAHTASLTISGVASAADYQTLLRTVTYQDVAGKPITSTRTAAITVFDGTNTASVSEFVTVTAVNQPPVVQVNDSTQLSYQVNTASIAIMSQALITDPDTANLSSLTVQISSGFQAGHDVMGYGTVSGISASYNATTGLLTLSGVSSVSNYRQALREVTFHTMGTGVSTATRTFKVIATDTTNTSSVPVTRNVTVTT